MEIKQAIKILKEYVKIDREVRETEDCSNDFDKFCEEKCIAIEALINFVEAGQIEQGREEIEVE